jgi:hypothetical protein
MCGMCLDAGVGTAAVARLLAGPAADLAVEPGLLLWQNQRPVATIDLLFAI